MSPEKKSTGNMKEKATGKKTWSWLHGSNGDKGAGVEIKINVA